MFLENALRQHVGDHAHVLVQAKAMTAPDYATLRAALATYIPDAAARDSFTHLEPPQPGAARKKRDLVVPIALAACVIAAIAGGLWIAWPKPPMADGAPAVALSPPTEATAPPAGDTPPSPTTAQPAAPASAPAPPKAAEPARPAAAKAATEKKAPREAPRDTKNMPSAASPAPAASGHDSIDSTKGAPPRNATLRFQVNGNADIYVDGIRVGASSSVSQYMVTPGEHRIQFRECGFPPSTKNQSVSVQENDVKLVVNAC